MSDHREHDRYDETLRRALQPVPLSPRQRRRHRERIAAVAAGAPGRSQRRGGRLEFAVVGAALLLIVAGIYAWPALWDGDGGDDDRIASGATEPAAQASPTDPSASEAEAPPPTATMPGLSLEQGLESITSDVCEVSPYATDMPAVAPAGLSFPDWYGDPSGGLWAAPADLAVVRPGSSPSFESGGQRWFAGAPTVVQVYGSTEPLTIRGERADGEDSFEVSPDATVDPATTTQRAAFVIPSPGCWTISASAGESELSIVVDVLPREERPDLVFLEQLAAIHPYAPPASCPATPLTEPQLRGGAIVYRYWMENGDIAVDIDQGWHVAGRQESMNVVMEPVEPDARVIARLRSDPDMVIEPEIQSPAAFGVYAIVIFPEPGCWELIVEASSRTAVFTTYVYPSDCAPPEGLLALPPSCRAPHEKDPKHETGLQA